MSRVYIIEVRDAGAREWCRADEYPMRLLRHARQLANHWKSLKPDRRVRIVTYRAERTIEVAQKKRAARGGR